MPTGDNSPANAVVLEEEGDIGKYNRANRSMHHFIENVVGFTVGRLRL